MKKKKVNAPTGVIVSGSIKPLSEKDIDKNKKEDLEMFETAMEITELVLKANE